jgi:hypothetical protein
VVALKISTELLQVTQGHFEIVSSVEDRSKRLCGEAPGTIIAGLAIVVEGAFYDQAFERFNNVVGLFRNWSALIRYALEYFPSCRLAKALSSSTVGKWLHGASSAQPIFVSRKSVIA